MGIKDYVCAYGETDNFEADESGGLSFPCCACVHADGEPDDEPCASCCHNEK